MSTEEKDLEIRVLRAALDIAAHETERCMFGIASHPREMTRVNQWVIKGSAYVKKEDEKRAQQRALQLAKGEKTN